MKQPDIAKRILPLLDIMFILLALFILLPNGIKSDQELANEMLKEDNYRVKNKLEQYKWKYGGMEGSFKRNYRIFPILVKNNRVYINDESIPLEKLEETLDKIITQRRITLITIQVRDVAMPPTELGTIETIEKIIERFSLFTLLTKDKKMAKKRRKFKFFGIVTLIAVLAFIFKFGFNFGQAGSWFMSQVDQISVQPETVDPKKDKQPEATQEEKVKEKVFIPMDFRNYQLYLDNQSCPTSQELTNKILDLKRDHSGKKIYIEYKAKSDDPYKKSVEVKEILEEHGFFITTDKDGVK